MSRNGVFLLIFVLMALQMFMSLVQIKHYQKTVRSLQGTGILGIGQRKGGLFSGSGLFGEIMIISYNRQEDRMHCVRSLKGWTVFAQFTDIKEYEGMSLEELRAEALKRDAKEFKRFRKRYPYDPKIMTKKKGAMIQAVEAIDLRLKREAEAAARAAVELEAQEQDCLPDMG